MNKPVTYSALLPLLAIVGVFSAGFSGEPEAQCAAGLWSDDWEVKATGAFGANEVIADDQQNVYAIGQNENDQPSGLLLVKYDKEGVELWRQVYADALGQTSAQAIEFDNKGNVVVTGYGYGLGHVVTVSYTPAGVLRWVNSFGSVTYSYLNPVDLATDDKGNSYVTGSATDSGRNESYDAFVIKINRKGKLEWARYYNGPVNDLDYAVRVRVDGRGDVFLGGATTSRSADRDFLTLKYDKGGKLVWARTYNGPDNLSDSISDLEVTGGGDVVATGYSYSGRTTVRYDNKGNQQWARHEVGPYNSEHSLALDKDSAAAITSSIGTYDGIEITRYDKYGNTTWVRTYAQATTIERDVQVDANQNVYVLGAVLGSGSEPPSAVVLVYDKNGNQLFSDLHAFANADIVVRELGLSCAGSFYFGAWDDYGPSDVITVRYEACQDNDFVSGCTKSNEAYEKAGGGVAGRSPNLSREGE